MEIALVEMAQRALPRLPAYQRLDEISFDADRMRLSTVHAMPEGPTLYCKGALESVLPLCSKILTDGDTRPLDSKLRAKILAAQESMAEQGLRVLAFARQSAGMLSPCCAAVLLPVAKHVRGLPPLPHPGRF